LLYTEFIDSLSTTYKISHTLCSFFVKIGGLHTYGSHAAAVLLHHVLQKRDLILTKVALTAITQFQWR